VIADVTHFSLYEGGEWHGWPFKASVKPSNPELLCKAFKIIEVPCRHEKYRFNFLCKQAIWRGRPGDGVLIRFHALRLSDGAEWDAVNGFRRLEDERPH
jgi:hypothetical protein